MSKKALTIALKILFAVVYFLVFLFSHRLDLSKYVECAGEYRGGCLLGDRSDCKRGDWHTTPWRK